MSEPGRIRSSCRSSPPLNLVPGQKLRAEGVGREPRMRSPSLAPIERTNIFPISADDEQLPILFFLPNTCWVRFPFVYVLFQAFSREKPEPCYCQRECTKLKFYAAQPLSLLTGKTVWRLRTDHLMRSYRPSFVDLDCPRNTFRLKTG